MLPAPADGVTHRATAFELTAAEWTATFEFLVRARALIDQQHAPDGQLIGWNWGPRNHHAPDVQRHPDLPLATC
jgi:hypothetical protein